MLTGEKMESYYYYILLYIVLDGIHQKNTIFVYNIRIYHQLSKIHVISTQQYETYSAQKKLMNATLISISFQMIFAKGRNICWQTNAIVEDFVKAFLRQKVQYMVSIWGQRRSCFSIDRKIQRLLSQYLGIRDLLIQSFSFNRVRSTLAHKKL